MRWDRTVAVVLALIGVASCSSADVADEPQRADPTLSSEPSPELEVESGRVHVELVAGEGTKRIPKFLDVEIEVEIADGGKLASVDLEGGGGPNSSPRDPGIESIFEEGSQVYVRLGSGPKRLRKKWALMSLHEFETQLPHYQGLMKLADAEFVLNAGAFVDDEDVAGRGTVDGVPATIYETRTTLEEMQEAVVLPEALVSEVESSTGGEIRFKTWVDRHGLVRRFTYPIKGSHLAPRAGLGEVLYQIDISDHDEEIVVKLPEDDDVACL